MADRDSAAPGSAADLTNFVQNLLQQMQARFQQMSDNIITRVDEMGNRIDELEKSISELIDQAAHEESDRQVTTKQ
jgi:heat shock factor-binding protein 1